MVWKAQKRRRGRAVVVRFCGSTICYRRKRRGRRRCALVRENSRDPSEDAVAQQELQLQLEAGRHCRCMVEVSEDNLTLPKRARLVSIWTSSTLSVITIRSTVQNCKEP
eukprot:364516-Chlamydomonas_euryale.AAC.27